MDPRRFDSLTQSLASAKTRRGLLGTLTALGAGLLGARGADAQQVTQAYCGNQVCASSPGSCKPGCVCCVYTNSVGQVTNSRCRPPGTCSPGTETGGTTPAPTTTTARPTTTTTTTTPAPTCASGLAEGAQCGVGLVCLDGSCQGNGVCTAADLSSCGPTTCAVDGHTDTHCVADIEGGITCVGNRTCGATCTSSAECEAGYACVAAPVCQICLPVCGASAERRAAAVSAAATGGPSAFEVPKE